MKMYQEYLRTRQVREGFITWLLIRKMTFRYQCIVIFLLISSWLAAAPYLIFWVNFFKGAVILSVLLLLFHISKKVMMYLKERSK